MRKFVPILGSKLIARIFTVIVAPHTSPRLVVSLFGFSGSFTARISLVSSLFKSFVIL